MFEKLRELTTGFFTKNKEEEAKEKIAEEGFTIVSEKNATIFDEKGKMFVAVKLEAEEDIN